MKSTAIPKEHLFKVILTKEARDFLKSLPLSVSEKIAYNMRRVMGGERNIELFKKLENTEIWEFRTLYNKKSYRLFAFWDNRSNAMVPHADC